MRPIKIGEALVTRLNELFVRLDWYCHVMYVELSGPWTELGCSRTQGVSSASPGGDL